VEKEHLILQEHLSGEGTYYPSGAPKWRRNILSFRCTYVEKDHLILQEHLSGEGTSFPSGAPNWRRNILFFPCI
jgi:hypothetical protein